MDNEQESTVTKPSIIKKITSSTGFYIVIGIAVIFFWSKFCYTTGEKDGFRDASHHIFNAYRAGIEYTVENEDYLNAICEGMIASSATCLEEDCLNGFSTSMQEKILENYYNNASGYFAAYFPADYFREYYDNVIDNFLIWKKSNSDLEDVNFDFIYNY